MYKVHDYDSTTETARYMRFTAIDEMKDINMRSIV